MQSRKQSLLESILNIIIGYSVALAGQLFIYPKFDIPVSLNQNILLGIFFTVLSLCRSYGVRRLFNWIGICRINKQFDNIIKPNKPWPKPPENSALLPRKDVLLKESICDNCLTYVKSTITISGKDYCITCAKLLYPKIKIDIGESQCQDHEQKK